MKSSRLFMLGLVLLLSGTSVFGMDGGYYDYDGSDDIVGSYQNVYANFVDDLENEQGAVNMSDESPKRSLPRTIVNYVLTIAVLALSVCIAWCLAKGAIKIALKLVLVVAVLFVVGVLFGWITSDEKNAVINGVQQGAQIGAQKVVAKGVEVLQDPKKALDTVANVTNKMKGKIINGCKGVHCYVDAATDASGFFD
eukprot:527800_1